VIDRGKKKGKKMMFERKKSRKSKKTKVFFDKLEEILKGEGDCGSVVLCRIRMLVYFDIGACRKVGVVFKFS